MLQPHSGSAETRYFGRSLLSLEGFNPTRVLLKPSQPTDRARPHRRFNPTRVLLKRGGLDIFQAGEASFNPTRVLLKRA